MSNGTTSSKKDGSLKNAKWVDDADSFSAEWRKTHRRDPVEGHDYFVRGTKYTDANVSARYGGSMKGGNQNAVRAGVASSNNRIQNVVNKTNKNLGPPNKMMNYKDDAAWFDSHANWGGADEKLDKKGSQNLRELVMQGQVSYNPSTGKMEKIKGAEKFDASKGEGVGKYYDAQGESTPLGYAMQNSRTDKSIAMQDATKRVYKDRNLVNETFRNAVSFINPAAAVITAGTKLMQKEITGSNRYDDLTLSNVEKRNKGRRGEEGGVGGATVDDAIGMAIEIAGVKTAGTLFKGAKKLNKVIGGTKNIRTKGSKILEGYDMSADYKAVGDDMHANQIRHSGVTKPIG
tara:strand:- start:609 stop:1646 length:1038 start_codon:yes stop_codon:yes gene_type:complete